MSTRVYDFYGQDRLIEPRPEILGTTFRLIGAHLMSITSPGVYEERQIISQILHAVYAFTEGRLSRLVRRIASHETLECLLHQYDLAARMWRATPDEDREKEYHFASRRRALKHLSEQIVMRSPPEFAPVHVHNLILEIEESILCAELLVMVSTMSDQTHFLFPGHTRLTVVEGYVLPFRLELLPPYETVGNAFGGRMIKDRQYRPKCLPNPTADRDSGFQKSVLDKYFAREFGFTYGDFLNVIVRILSDVAPAPGSYPITFCHRDRLARGIASAAGMPLEISSRIISGFTLRSLDMKQEGRQLWNTKQIFRAYRRGFFEMPHATGPHLIWSNEMAGESLNWLVEGFSFRKAPTEWNTTAIQKGLDELSHEASSWFEQQTARCLNEMGIIGCRRKSRIQGNNCIVEIPSVVGEIDFLGSFQGDASLLIVECKMVESRMEARFWKEDVAEFVEAKKSYVEKFKVKINWVIENRRRICSALIGKETLRELRPVMITLYPTFASTRIDEFPCVSLAEFVADCEADSSWPYRCGVFTEQ
ncbi:MAG: hypothetical protein ACLQU4_14595 [Limisphaerales bacterium]